MATVVGCSGGAGRIIAIDSQEATTLTVGLSYAGGDDAEATEDLVRLGIVTQVQAAQNIAAQFQNALTDAIYVTPFGDLPGTVRVSFVTNRTCNKDEEVPLDAIQHYLNRRLLPGRNLVAATITIGSGTFRGYLVALLINGSSQGTPIVNSTLVFKAWPQ